MISIILCAGFGTRMYPLTLNQPKALLQVAGRPAIDYLIDQLMTFDRLAEIHVVTNGRFFTQFASWQRQTKTRIRPFGKTLYLHNNTVEHVEDSQGPIADLAFVLDRVGVPDGGLISAGDNIFLFDLRPVWERFSRELENLVIVLSQDDKKKLRRAGVAVLDEQNRIVEFMEKPSTPVSKWACLPLYFLNAAAMVKVKILANQSTNHDEMGHMVQHLVKTDRVLAIKSSGSRLDLGSLSDYQRAEFIVSSRRKTAKMPSEVRE